MSEFAEMLKAAKSGRVQVLHEFLTNFDPSSDRIHCFFEGREDEIFYRGFISSYTGCKIVAYICGNKRDVYAVCESVATHPGYRQSLFFVDKDLADLMNESYPLFERMFVTSFYSVENYLVRDDLFVRLCRDFIQCKGVVCNHDAVGDIFSAALAKFYALILPLMAWIVAVRRKGQSPNLRNIRLQTLFGLDSDLKPRKVMNRNRIAHLCTMCGITPIRGMAKDVREVLADLKARNPKQVVRGHFEGWFLVIYFKAFFERVKTEAENIGGTAAMLPSVEHTNFVALTVPHLQIPQDLNEFLQINL